MAKRSFSIIVLVSILINLFCCCFVLSVSANEGDVEIYRKKDNDLMQIALTFDDGPHPRLTPKILDILDKYGIKATFFAVGINAEYYPDTLKEIERRGHEIGNHTYTHPHVSVLDSEKLKREVEKCESMIYSLTECKTKLFRPPEGMIDNSVKGALKTLNYKVILWDIDTRDWAHTPPIDIKNHVVNNISSGDIILMHDYISYNSPTPEALELFIPILLQMGYKFVVVSDLIGNE